MVRKSEKLAHRKYNKEKMKSIAFRLHRESDAELITIYESIPDKMKFFREALRNYAKRGTK